MLTFPANAHGPGFFWDFHRNVDVAVSAQVTFQILEALFPPRPNHWARVWPTGVALSRWVLEQAPGSLGAHAVELGCGVGLLGVTLAHAGLATLGTDRQPMALAFAARNALNNAVAGFNTGLLDWADSQHGAQRFIVASDVLYEPETPEHLFGLLHTRGMLAPGGRLLLGCPRARPAPLEVLVERLCAQGYVHCVHDRSVDWEGRVEDIGLHTLVRPG